MTDLLVPTKGDLVKRRKYGFETLRKGETRMVVGKSTTDLCAASTTWRNYKPKKMSDNRGEMEFTCWASKESTKERPVTIIKRIK